jgi:hypothetical protein
MESTSGEWDEGEKAQHENPLECFFSNRPKLIMEVRILLSCAVAHFGVTGVLLARWRPA